MSGTAEKMVYRQVAIPVSAFDWLKHRQRAQEAQVGYLISNSEALAMIISEHKRLTVESGAQQHDITHGKGGT